MSLLGIDAGTSGAKLAAFNHDGRIIAFARKKYELHRPQKGFFELWPQEVWAAVSEGIREVAAATRGSNPITAIATSSLGESFVLLDSNGQELAGSPMYYDTRSLPQTKALTALGNDAFWRRNTGLGLNHRQSLPHLFWLAQNRPEVLAQAKTLLFYADYILHKLGAPPATDISLAATTMAFRPGSGWWDDALQFAGVNPAILPVVGTAGQPLGRVSAKAAASLGLSPDVQLVLGGHDQVLCALGTGTVNEKTAANSAGTSDTITPLVASSANTAAVFDAGFRLYRYPIGDYLYSSVYNQNGGALLDWFVSRFHIPTSGNPYDAVEANMPAGPSGLVMLPHFGGRIDDARAGAMRGALLGLSYDTDVPTMYKAMLEGQLFELRRHLDVFEAAAGRIEALNVVGGCAKSDINMQLRADVLNKTVRVMACDEATVLGAAILAGAGTGVFASVRASIEALVSPRAVFTPNEEAHLLYSAPYAAFCHYYTLLAQVPGIRT